MSDTIELMRTRLAALNPEVLEIHDDSAAHAGHAGAKSGGHYQLLIVSEQFKGLNRIARQRLVYAALGDLMQTRIHALAQKTLSPEEI